MVAVAQHIAASQVKHAGNHKAGYAATKAALTTLNGIVLGGTHEIQ